MLNDHANQDSPDDAHDDTHEDPREDTAEHLRAQLDAAVQELSQYRTRVRDRAIKGFHNGDWNLGKLNDSLEELGLEPFEPTYVHATQATFSLSLTVAESDDDGARAALASVNDDSVRNTIRDAITNALNQYTNTISVPDDHLTVSFGSLHKVMVD